MKNIHKKARRSVFLLAAEGIFIANHTSFFPRDEAVLTISDNEHVYCSRYCCNMFHNLTEDAYTVGNTDAEYLMFKDYFYSKEFEEGEAWWRHEEGEARILALLLCAEMLRG